MEPRDPVPWAGVWCRFRVVVQDDACTIWFHGRMVRQIALSEHSDPWFAIRSWWGNDAQFRNVTISGSPVVPEAVVMSAAKDLLNWLSYHNTSVGYETAAWQHMDDADSTGQIVGARWTSLKGTNSESLLRYHRPLAEDGSVEYDFFYEPGLVHTHPALDRLTFLLQRDGVRIHWVTDEKYDPTVVEPGNSFDESQYQRGPKMIPLNVADWNHVKLSLTGNTASLELNGHKIFERELNPGNHRTFGLFHFVGEEEVRVRNVIMRGNWPHAVPSPADHMLADKQVLKLDKSRAALKAVFAHSFEQGGLPAEYFRWNDSQAGSMQVRSDGVLAEMTASGNWSSRDLKLPFELHGDFDVEAAFSDLKFNGDAEAGILLNVNLNDTQHIIPRIARMHGPRARESLRSSWSEMKQGQRVYGNGENTASEALSGRLRIARRDSTMSFLFAEADSSVFQLVDEREFNAAETTDAGVDLRILCNGRTSGSVVWKSVRIAAEKLMFYPPKESAPGRTLHVLSVADGTVERVTDPLNGLKHLGSAEWSADGKQLVCDMSMGGTGTSHIMIMNADGTGAKDLGVGCMPSLSPDGMQLVFSRPGIMRMNTDGTAREQVESGGWGTQWSPDGKYIAWGAGNNITLLNVNTNARRQLLTAEQLTQIRSIYWNLGWSHNSRSIAFKASTPNGGAAVVVADVDSPEGFKFAYTGTLRVNEDFTWHPDGRRVGFSVLDPSTNLMRLATVNRDKDDEPVSGVPADWQTFDCDWSPDGKQIVFSALVPQTPVEWPVAEVADE